MATTSAAQAVLRSNSSVEGLEFYFGRSSRYEALLVKDAIPQDAIPVTPVTQAGLEALALEPLHAGWVRTSKFKAKAGEVCLLPSAQGSIARVLLGLGPSAAGGEPWPFAALAKLPGGTYRLEAVAAGAAEGADEAVAAAAAAVADRAALGFLLGHYAFERYKGLASGPGATATADSAGAATASGAAVESGEPEAKARLVWPAGCNRTHVTALARGFVWARDLITTPAEDLGPQHLAAEAAALATLHGASFRLLQGEELLEHNYPAIHTVGRASYRPPLLATLEWSPPGAEAAAGAAGAEPLPVLALVGKGVCFDTGGLDLKPAASMKNMKKDMGGAALVLALAHAVMAARLRCRLRVLVPAVENAVAGNAFRPLDVLQTRAGITVENGNTDAEGRLILADALADALGRDSRRATATTADNFQLPDLLIDAATLTGAARVALGADLPAVFANDDETWRALEAAAAATGDPVWRLPLHAPYRKSLDSKIADLSSTGAGDGLAGAIIAALFLQEFAKGAPRWLHIDTNAFNVGGAVGPGRPEGGEAQGLRALFAMLTERYGAAA
ncbi:hypothetical protein HYH02_013894 [Chlamydomonas schloesseri]|uniref:Cytosol aminopeptidase domain-containing protein n=1 Tax=Chlamydomonas schloesseri TaxID=2026947 RepID=A0A835VXX3_9CHLO|nr:hypothetical protein HYH02_013894 [Chlamydomonas schloesseri]|eukprot:KAG2429943.1 hypothetical protein HYH02_013894 [Chlamydomonas schloesseri]